jgi:NADH-quinone oxidoreductase subunit M
MTYVLSLLIIIPLIGSGATFALSTLGAGSGRKTASLVAAAFACATLLVAGYAFWTVYAHTPALGNYALMEDHPWITLPGIGVDILLGLDGLSAPLVLVSGIVAVLAILSSRSLIDKNEPAYYSLLLIVLASVMGTFTSLNLVVFYLFWELTLIPMFFLIGVWGGDRRKYAALKFIIFTFAGSAVMLLGFLALYFGLSPSTFDIPNLAKMGIPAGLQYLPLLAVFVGFAVELPVFPFHSWQPDAYEQAPAPVNALLSGILPKFAGYAVIRIALGLFPQAAYQYAWAFIIVAIFSMFYGAVVALFQSDLKRMFAYTSISHMGFVLLGAFATVLSGNPLGIEGAILLMFTHALATGSLFTLSGFVEKQSGTRKIPLLGGMGQRVPLTAALLAVASAAMMGIPPFASFLAELMVISGGISAYASVAVTVLVPVITGGYFLWMLKRVIIDPAPPAAGGSAASQDLSRADATVVALYLVPLVVLTVFSFLILSPAAPVAQWTANLVHGGLHG